MSQTRTLFRIFGVPVTVRGWEWLPVAPLVAWGFLAWLAGRQRPGRSTAQRLQTGAWNAAIALGAELCHNLAHVVGARAVGKPPDEIRIFSGLTRLVYADLNPQDVTPRQHIARSLGGPLVNSLFTACAWLLRRRLLPDDPAYEAADWAVKVNTFLSTFSLLPIPGIDGGPILKWSLVQAGRSPADADQVVQRANLALSPLLAAWALSAWRSGQRLWATLLAMLSVTCLGIGIGRIREDDFQVKT